MWSADAIRARREAKGFSLTDLAQRLDVTKSYMSLIETGKRSLTSDQAQKLGELLCLPTEMLLIGSGRLPTDVQTAIDADAAEVTTAVRARADQSAVRFQSEPQAIPCSKPERAARAAASSPPAIVAVNKTSTSYRAHSYHTKVPPAAIVPFIEAFTEVGDVVLDSFCGSGMTGVAALSVGRNALLSDFSPAAVHIARNYTSPCDPEAFERAFKRVGDRVKPTMNWLYTPLQEPQCLIEYTTWSDVFSCAACGGQIVYWEVFGNSDRDFIECRHCGAKARKADLTWVGEEPVQSHARESGSRRITAHTPSPQERALVAEIEAAPVPYWTPNTAFGSDREMWRASHRAMGIADAAGFYTKRNLHALAALRHAILAEPDLRLREALLFAFTACVNRASKRYQWNAKRPTNVMTGTLYISSLRYEWNVWSLFGRKAADVLRYYRTFSPIGGNAEVYQRSATDLGCIPDSSIDMIFVDPPFGSNIFYADSSLLWDAWLGSATDQGAEIVVNQRRSRLSGGKDIESYGGLLAASFKEAARVLRRGGRGVLAFSNSDDRVWTAVQDALSDAGLDVLSAHILDKGQPSIKGVKGHLGQEHVTRLDLTLCLGHRTRPAKVERSPATTAFVDGAIARAVAAGHERNDQIYTAVLRDALKADLSVSGITMPAIEKRRSEISDVATPMLENNEHDFVAGYLSDGADLPASRGSSSPDLPPAQRTVPGGRNTAFYMAHSYHTKVPPEAIRPFIEHFTKPGDVVLDPFAGSGMTGLAAALAGREAIVNDLSPVATHLAWNHTRPCDGKALTKAFIKVEKAVSSRLTELYATKDESGRPAQIRWTIWSTRHRCPACNHVFALWDTMDRKTGRLGRATQCPRCLTEADRRRFEVVENVPAWVAFERRNGSLGEKPADAADIQHALAIAMDEELWWPSTPLGPDREMYQRCALHLQGVSTVADLYTSRNLTALALIWREILKVTDERIKRALAFAFTNTAWHGTRMRRFNARGGHRPLTGTLYVPQLSSEANVLEVMRKKIRQLVKYYDALDVKSANCPRVLLGSATMLSSISSESIDYVFTDPPFGSNIFYADCNVVWESWLGRITDPEDEAVVNRSLPEADGGKSLADYEILMTAAMKEMARVLKPGGWATVVFHNTDPAVWRSLRDAATTAGFEFHEAASLDRKQQSHKGYKGRGDEEDVAHFDVVMNLRKPLVDDLPKATPTSAKSERIDLPSLVERVWRMPDIAARGVQGVHAEVMRQLVSLGGRDFPAFSEVRTICEALADPLDSKAWQTYS
ncbi:DNA methyltransferase [Aquamicrobium sp. LC103]|uniref:DNA methyltransferase n=1 Tax=Aquamicrobium sp. LC103 TaxID=1120658 RepID=UPI00069B84FB|nr:DNA methyltransferase [Aquamicrobium sp. LC103]TKT82470.1 helix-turn-helix domain-containing protein [Aquamicrobium sp. LC103]